MASLLLLQSCLHPMLTHPTAASPSAPPAATAVQVMFSVGVVIAYLAGLPYWFQIESVTLCGLDVPWWRVMVSMAAVLALAQAACLWACPESPSWLETRDKERADEACIAL